MKLISLNTWGGKIFEPLINFLKDQSSITDVFCLQEIFDTTSAVKQYNGIRANLLDEIKKVLTDFQVFYFKTLIGYDDETNRVVFNLTHGPAIFIKKNIQVNSHQNFFIYRPKSLKQLRPDSSNLATPLQYVSFYVSGKKFLIFNFHGTPFPQPKKDTNKRLEQSNKIKQIMESLQGSKILVGDFNLSKNTKSIKILEEDMKNLIKEFKIKKTRSNLSPFFEKSNFQKFADYTFVTPDIKVLNFQVLEAEISDHLPMILGFE